MTPCIEWAGGRTSRNYGAKHDDGKQVLVHRWVMAQVTGWAAIEGKVVMHLCDNPPCYRLDHLRVGTQLDNVWDMLDKGRHRGGQKPGGGSILNESEVLAIVQERRAGDLRRVIASRHCVSESCVDMILGGHSWSWLTGIKRKGH